MYNVLKQWKYNFSLKFSFNGHGDFTSWQQLVKHLLSREGTIRTLKVKTHRTEKMTDDEWVTLKEKDKSEKTSIEEWEDSKDMTISTILLCLTNNTLQDVLDLTDVINIWDKLESQYKYKSLTSRLYLKK